MNMYFRLLALLALVALIAAGCAAAVPQAVDSTPVVSEVLAVAEETLPPSTTTVTETTAPAPAISVPPGCRLTTMLDEYGFEIEVVDCGEPVEAQPENPDWLGSESAAEVAKLMRVALIDQPACGVRTTYSELRTRISEAVPELREPLLEAVAALERGAAECNRDQDAWAEAMREAIGFIDDFLLAAAELAPADETGADS